MSLDANDLQQIREICREENQALENDIKDIYHIILSMQKQIDGGFKVLGEQIAAIADQTGATL